MDSKIYPVARFENLVVQELDGEVLIYDLAKNKAFCLNQSSALVWQMCDGKNSVNKIKEKLSQKLKTSVKKELVWLAIEELKSEDLIEDVKTNLLKTNGLTRREVIRKVGVGSMIALPIISSIVAPNSIAAMSCIQNNQPVGGIVPQGACGQFNAQCCSGNAGEAFGLPGGQVTCQCVP